MATKTAAVSSGKRSQEENHEALGASCQAPIWNPHLNSYKEKSVLTFPSQEHLGKAIDLLWADELRTLPHSTVGRKTLIVPAEAVTYFTRAGLTFTATRLRSITELPAKEVKKLRREQGPY
ncbi:MAG: hypothetical protein L0Z62_40530 [Gemmataceae bacterium]|nr:hypothetical protein [Gemmataceae bacterium]